MFVTKKKYDELYAENKKLGKENYHLSCDYERAKNGFRERKAQAEELEKEVERLNEGIKELKSTYADHNTITLTVRDDLTQVVPTVKVKPEVFDKMVELGYMDDHVTSETKSHLMQTAMLVIGAEALEQIVESMSQPLHED